MIYVILFTSGLVTFLFAIGTILVHARRLSTGQIVIESGYSGPDQVKRAFIILLRIFLKRTVTWRRLLLQYVLHVWVRALFYFGKLNAYLYAKSRNFFVKNAVKNRNTVPHFWHHLKVYKQEIDREKEREAGLM